MVRLFKTALFIIGFIIIIAVVLVVTGHGNILQGVFTVFVAVIKQFWVWIIGLFGFVFASFKKILSLFGPSQAEKEIAAENESIKEELQRLREQLKTYDDQFKKEKELHARENAIFQKELLQKNIEIQSIKQGIEEQEELGPEGFFHNLSDEEKKEYNKEYYNNVRVFN
jgi:hypothetical protein